MKNYLKYVLISFIMRIMKRILYNDLLKWKESKSRRPLILQGARQVGKSYLLKQLGENAFKDFHLFNFEQDKRLSLIFEKDLFPERIIKELSLVIEKNIDIENDLLIFDEIQECPNAIASLKYFSEDLPGLALCGAGSLIGVKLSSESFPVGKVEFFHLYPMNFEEFLMARGDTPDLELLRAVRETGNIPGVLHEKTWDKLKEYYITGGMPQIVKAYLEGRDNPVQNLEEVRRLQKQLIYSYGMDFAKHSGKINSMHIIAVFENIPLQLSRNIDGTVKRYYFKDVLPKKKGYSSLEGPIQWLEKAGLVLRSKICNRAEIPLESFTKNNIFKLFVFDTGLLGAMLDLPAQSIETGDYGITKGFFAENFVAQEFKAAGTDRLYSWEENSSEIEFLRVMNGKIVPVEVKSGRRTRAKSLGQFIDRYSPETAIKISGRNLEINNDNVIKNYPLYMAGML